MESIRECTNAVETEVAQQASTDRWLSEMHWSSSSQAKVATVLAPKLRHKSMDVHPHPAFSLTAPEIREAAGA